MTKETVDPDRGEKVRGCLCQRSKKIQFSSLQLCWPSLEYLKISVEYGTNQHKIQINRHSDL